MNSMRFRIAAAVVTFVAIPTASFAAPRNWTQMSKIPDSAVYSDMANIIRTGTTIRYWILLDDTSGKQPKSFVMRNEVNCETMEWRRVYAAVYDDQMGTGNEKSSVYANALWKPALPEDSIVLAFPICEAFKQLDREASQGLGKK